jgi:hypothetical protein
VAGGCTLIFPDDTTTMATAVSDTASSTHFGFFGEEVLRLACNLKSLFAAVDGVEVWLVWRRRVMKGGAA